MRRPTDKKGDDNQRKSEKINHYQTTEFCILHGYAGKHPGPQAETTFQAKQFMHYYYKNLTN